MMSLSRVMAVEVAELGIRVNAVAPGMTHTALVEQGVQDGSIRLDTMLPEIPMGRLATPDDIAGAVLFLASDDARYITGQTLVVDGGWSILGMHDRPDWLTAGLESRRGAGGRAKACRPAELGRAGDRAAEERHPLDPDVDPPQAAVHRGAGGDLRAVAEVGDDQRPLVEDAVERRAAGLQRSP